MARRHRSRRTGRGNRVSRAEGAEFLGNNQAASGSWHEKRAAPVRELI
jgi:hypothetical protein